jgi:hypothetical protein
MLEALAATAGTTTHRCTTSKPHWGAWRRRTVWGAPRIHGELLKLGFTVSERTVSRYMPDRRKAPSQSWHFPRERVRPVRVRLDGDVIGRGGRSRCRQRLCLRFRPAEPSFDRRSAALPRCGHPPIGVPRVTALLLAGLLSRISRTTAQLTSHCNHR